MKTNRNRVAICFCNNLKQVATQDDMLFGHKLKKTEDQIPQFSISKYIKIVTTRGASVHNMCFLLVLFSLSSYQLANGSREWERSFKKLLDKDHPETTRTFALIHCKIELSGHTSKNRTVNRYRFQVECTYRKRFKERLTFCDQQIKEQKTAELFWLNLRKYICVSVSLCVYMYEVS